MIHIDQVRTLEIKVKQAVQLVVHLRRENDHLRSRLADTEVRIQEMEDLLGALKTAQTQIELGIQSALNDLGQIDQEAMTQTSDDLAPQVAEVSFEAPQEEILQIIGTSSRTSGGDVSKKEESGLDFESSQSSPSEAFAFEESDRDSEAKTQEEDVQPGLDIF